jgi:hypothetical protein
MTTDFDRDDEDDHVVDHVCTVSSSYSVRDVMRALGFVRRRWSGIREAAGGDAKFCRRAWKQIARCSNGAQGKAVARWDVYHCGDYTPLRNAIERAMPRATWTLLVINGAIEAMAFGYWNGEAACENSDEHPVPT